MLILITTRCLEGCSHCLHDARPDGSDMTRETFQNVLIFLGKVRPLCIQISGGEPTLHSHFSEFVERISSKFKNSFLLLESNGSFYKDPEKLKTVERLLRLENVHLQIRSHEDYYPNYKSIVDNPALKQLPKTVLWTDGKMNIQPIGRASNMQPTIKWRTCINTYLLAMQKPFLPLPLLIRTLQQAGRYCSPMIDPEGVLHAGESRLCTSLGHVTKPLRVLDTTACGKCGLAGPLEV